MSLNESKWYGGEGRIEDTTKRKKANRKREIYDALDDELQALEEISDLFGDDKK